jgi:hypothetical protein
MGFNLTTDDVWDERERMGLNKPSKVKSIWEVKTPTEEVLFTGTIYQIKGKVQKHFGKTARWSKRGRWRLLLNENNYAISKL